jgi:hypothetical protein
VISTFPRNPQRGDCYDFNPETQTPSGSNLGSRSSLLSSSLPLREIARKLGYSSTQTLSRFIRQEFGTTPIELRRELQRA